jgi:hypothetical protein
MPSVCARVQLLIQSEWTAEQSESCTVLNKYDDSVSESVINLLDHQWCIWSGVTEDVINE